MKHSRNVLLLVTAGWLAGCAPLRPLPSPADRPPNLRLEHHQRNRCAFASERTCNSDADCPGDRCVSVLRTDAGAFGRDGGHTLRLGEQVLWQFGDSFVEGGMLSSTAGWSDTADPHSLRDTRTDTGAPAQFLPFTQGELAFNRSHAVPPACCRQQTDCAAGDSYCHCPETVDCTWRIALWPGDGAEVAEGTALVYYDRQYTGVAPYDFRPAGVGVATVRAGAAAAERALDERGEPRLLFQPDEPHFTRGLRVDIAEGSFFYSYAIIDRHDCSVDILAARVPLAHMDDRSHFRFWNGHTWTPDLRSAEPILNDILGGLGSVVWSPQLGRYIAAWNDLCTPGDWLQVRTAAAPQGPWSEPVGLDLAAFGALPDAYYATLHPELSQGDELLLSYFQPVGLVDGQIRLLRLRWARH